MMRQLDWLTRVLEVMSYGGLCGFALAGRAAAAEYTSARAGLCSLSWRVNGRSPLRLSDETEQIEDANSPDRWRNAAVPQAPIRLRLITHVFQGRIRRRRASQPAAAFVFRVAGVAFYPLPFDDAAPQRRIQAFPEIDILNRLFVRRFPAAFSS